MDNINENTNKSGGPKTETGKSICKYNAVRHGILVNSLLKDEKEEAEIIQTKLEEEFQPQTITEELLIESMAVSFIRTQRVYKEELEVIALLRTVDIPSGNLFVRYLATSERQFYRALHELQRIQAIRNGYKPTSMAVDFIGANNGG